MSFASIGDGLSVLMVNIPEPRPNCLIMQSVFASAQVHFPGFCLSVECHASFNKVTPLISTPWTAKKFRKKLFPYLLNFSCIWTWWNSCAVVVNIHSLDYFAILSLLSHIRKQRCIFTISLSEIVMQCVFYSGLCCCLSNIFVILCSGNLS